MNTNTAHTALLLALASAVGFFPAQGIAAGANTAYGNGALISMEYDADNSAFGANALGLNTIGNKNTAGGANALYSNIDGGENTAIGFNSLFSNINGIYNTAAGVYSLYSNTSGSSNVAIGYTSLSSNTVGHSNTASGDHSLSRNTSGSGNTASGSWALFGNTTGNGNSAFGSGSLSNNTYGYLNTASGQSSLGSNTHGNYNTAYGAESLVFNIFGSHNTAIGANSLLSNTLGSFNTALGSSALLYNSEGSANVAIGQGALYANTTGNYNVGIGDSAGFSNKTGKNNVFIGRSAGFYETGKNALYIANNATVPLLYGKFSPTAADNKLGIGTSNVPINDAIRVWNGAHLTKGGVWTNASSRDLKDDVESLNAEDANRALAGLLPVRYVYKNSRDEEYLGFIAEDVPALVANNDRKSLSPMDIVAVLTTVAKAQRAMIEEQQVKAAEKAGEIAALQVSLAQQEERIQRMATDNEARLQELELALAEVLRNQSLELRVGSAH